MSIFFDLFNPNNRNRTEELRRLENTREEEGQGEGGRGPIDLSSGTVRIRIPAKDDSAPTDSAPADSEPADAEPADSIQDADEASDGDDELADADEDFRAETAEGAAAPGEEDSGAQA